MKAVTRTILTGAMLLASASVLGQPYPSRPVRVVVPLSPGGFADTPARMLAPRLSDQLGRQFFVENKPGAALALVFGHTRQPLWHTVHAFLTMPPRRDGQPG